MNRISIFAVDTQTILLKKKVNLLMLQGDEVQLVRFVAPTILCEIWRGLQCANRSVQISPFSHIYVVFNVGPTCKRLRIGEIVVPSTVEHTASEVLILSETACIRFDVLLNDPTIACSMCTSIEVLRLLDSFIQPEMGRWVIHTPTSYGLDHYLIQLARRRGIGIISILDPSKPTPSVQKEPQHHIVVDGPNLKADVVRIVRQDPVGLGLDTGTQFAPIVSLLNCVDIKQYGCFPIHQTIDKTSKQSSKVHLVFSLNTTDRFQKQQS